MRRSAMIHIRLSSEEIAEADTLAEFLGLSRSALFRYLVKAKQRAMVVDLAYAEETQQ